MCEVACCFRMFATSTLSCSRCGVSLAKDNQTSMLYMLYCRRCYDPLIDPHPRPQSHEFSTHLSLQAIQPVCALLPVGWRPATKCGLHTLDTFLRAETLQVPILRRGRRPVQLESSSLTYSEQPQRL